MADVEQDRLQRVLDVVMRLAAGELDARGELSGTGDEVDGLQAGVNMLAEELQSKLVENSRLIRELEQKVELLTQHHETILSLSTPALTVWQDIAILPLIGTLDSERARQLSAALLDHVGQHHARVVIIDVTGASAVDSAVSRHLLDTINATRLLGARCILTGVSPQNAQSMVHLGIEMTGVATRGNLYAGLKLAFALTGRRVIDAGLGQGG